VSQQTSEKASIDHSLVDFWANAANPAVIKRWRRSILRRRLLWKVAVVASETMKRTLDIVGGLVGCLFFAPILTVVAILIKIEDGGPVFFRQLRIGKGGKPIYILKVRSMVLNAEEIKRQLEAQNQHAEGVTFKMKRDPRITKVGKWIRKLSLDEAPQIWSVLKGDMALVGPRPPVPQEVQKYNSFELRRLTVKPGLTCLWQIGGRSDIDFSGQVRLDLQYIYSESIWKDIKILFLTVPAVLMGRGAY
jgi:lipopolysaccharide/colanic/teichoic acid biosynthesis glycosyltransferase